MARFRNLDPFQKRGPADILRWKILDTIAGRRRKDRNDAFVTPRVENDGSRLHALEPSLTWIGHATFVLRLGGLVVATDPIWSRRLATLKRNTPPGVALKDLPPIDVVTISHAHYDHLDVRTLVRLSEHTTRLRGTPPTFLVPSEVSRYIPRDLGPVIERAWWEDHHVDDVARARGGITFSLVPQQHWSMRKPWDRDETLWGGWVMKSNEGTAYHAGDTATFDHFAEIGARKGPIDWAMLPIGAYDPQWFMKPQHMGPEEAGRAFVALEAKNLVCMHWGTFQLTDEPLSEPPARIERWWEKEGPGRNERDRLWTMAVGETRALR